MRLALLWALGFAEKDGRIQAKAWRRVWEVRAEGTASHRASWGTLRMPAEGQGATW